MSIEDYKKGLWNPFMQYKKGIEPPINWNDQDTVTVFCEGVGDVCYIANGNLNHEDQEKLARLISLAPQMLIMLKNFRDLIAAIEKDTGARGDFHGLEDIIKLADGDYGSDLIAKILRGNFSVVVDKNGA